MDHEHQPETNDPTADSTTRRAEDIADDEKEAGRTDTGRQGETQRPTGTSSARDFTSIDPQEPRDGGSPAG
jgi:hypothetical protein